DRLGDFSADGFAARDRLDDDWLARFQAFTENEPFPPDRLDRALTVAHPRGERPVRPFARRRRQPRLCSDPLPRRPSCAFLRHAVDEWLKQKELLDHDAASLREWGDEFYGETEAALNAAAMELGHQDWRAAVEALRQDHPTEDTLVETYRAEMERSRLAVATSGLATVPYGEDLVVEAMPEFQRPTYPYAAYVGAGPFEPSRRGRFWVTLPDAHD